MKYYRDRWSTEKVPLEEPAMSQMSFLPGHNQVAEYPEVQVCKANFPEVGQMWACAFCPVSEF
jgi:hypothetical protein